jgi:AAA domain
MPSLSNHQSNEFTKLLLVGNAKSGKTGSLVSLVKAGYKLRILDLDNLLDVLKYCIIEQCPELINNVEFRTIRDKRKMTPAGPIIDGAPKAFVDAIKMLDHWKYKDDDGTEIDLGKPGDWGRDCILVIDSLSRLCDAAYDWREPLTPRGRSGDYDKRATYKDAQDAIEATLATLTSKAFQTNLIVVAHVLFQDQPDGSIKGFPQGVGQKLSPKIPQYFPSVVLYTNQGGKRSLQTNSTPLIDLANPRPFAMAKSYSIETGLAEFFAVLQDPPKAKPKLIRRA